MSLAVAFSRRTREAVIPKPRGDAMESRRVAGATRSSRMLVEAGSGSQDHEIGGRRISNVSMPASRPAMASRKMRTLSGSRGFDGKSAQTGVGSLRHSGRTRMRRPARTSRATSIRDFMMRPQPASAQSCATSPSLQRRRDETFSSTAFPAGPTSLHWVSALRYNMHSCASGLAERRARHGFRDSPAWRRQCGSCRPACA